MKKEIKIKFVTRKDTTTNEFCREFFDVLINKHPRMAPDLYDWDVTCRRLFTGIEDALPSWAFRTAFKEMDGKKVIREIPTIWGNHIKNKTGARYFCSISHTQETVYGNPILGLFNFYARPDRKLDWLAVFRDLTAVIEPVLGRMHIYVGGDAVGGIIGSPQSQFMSGPHHSEMKLGLTNLGWANVFSEEYAAEVDKSRLREHGFVVEAAPGGKLFTVTDNLFDLLDDFPKFSRRRAELKGLFRPDLFLIKDEPSQEAPPEEKSAFPLRTLIALEPDCPNPTPIEDLYFQSREAFGERVFFAAADPSCIKDGKIDLSEPEYYFVQVLESFRPDEVRVANEQLGDLRNEKLHGSCEDGQKILEVMLGKPLEAWSQSLGQAVFAPLDLDQSSARWFEFNQVWGGMLSLKHVTIHPDRVLTILAVCRKPAVLMSPLYVRWRQLIEEYEDATSGPRDDAGAIIP